MSIDVIDVLLWAFIVGLGYLLNVYEVGVGATDPYGDSIPGWLLLGFCLPFGISVVLLVSSLLDWADDDDPPPAGGAA